MKSVCQPVRNSGDADSVNMHTQKQKRTRKLASTDVPGTGLVLAGSRSLEWVHKWFPSSKLARHILMILFWTKITPPWLMHEQSMDELLVSSQYYKQGHLVKSIVGTDYDTHYICGYYWTAEFVEKINCHRLNDQL